jgi:SAM-dependent methyltransferase
MLNNFLQFIKKTIVSSQFFWKYRDLLNKNWLTNTVFENKFFFNKEIIRISSKLPKKLILDFGCGASSTLLQFAKKYNSICYGIDINKEAVRFSSNLFIRNDIKNFFFTNYINKKHIRYFLNKNNFKIFDIVIADRVFYSLPNKMLKNFLDLIKNYAKYIIIDDFFDKDRKFNKYFNYKHRDYDKIMNNLGYNLVSTHDTFHLNKNFNNGLLCLYLKK